MIFTHEHLTEDRGLSADVCVIGSGAGGSAAAHELAKSGRKVLILERGAFLAPSRFTQREEEMFPRLFYDGGGRRTRDRAIRVLHGHGVGGSTLHNLNLCKRVPDPVLREWELPRLTPEAFAPFLEKTERILGVTPLEESQLNLANRLFREGCERLRYRGGLLRHNRQGCVGSGFCELGCAFDAKLNAMRVLLPEAVRLGATICADTRAVELECEGRRVRRVLAEVLSPNGGVQARLHVTAKSFVLACGAIETPLLLQRSGGVPDPHGLVGSRLHLHPGAACAGVFGSPVESWRGIPQSYECTEFLRFESAPSRPSASSFGRTSEPSRVWIISGAAHPAGAAALLPGFGQRHKALMDLYPRLVPLTPMLHDRTRGSVRARGERGARIDYVLEDADRRELAGGLREAARILLAAGAREVILPLTDALRVSNIADLERAPIEIRDGGIDIVSVHPMSSVWMGRDPADSCLDDSGRYHHLDNLFVADASVFPTSLGTPPQITTYAMGFYVASGLKNI